MKAGNMLIVCHSSVPDLKTRIQPPDPLPDWPKGVHQSPVQPIAGISAVTSNGPANSLWNVLMDCEDYGQYYLIESGSFVTDSRFGVGRRFRLPLTYSPLGVLEVAAHMLELEQGITLDIMREPVEVPARLVQRPHTYHPYQDLH